MRATLDFLNDKFHYFNIEIFNNELPEPLMHITSARSFMGQFKVKSSGSLLKREVTYHITVSNCYDLDLHILEDIIIHEMIHFLIHVRKMRDTSTHGNIFCALMRDINSRFNRNITVSHRCTRQQLESDKSKSHSIMCICTMADGRHLACRVSQSKVFEIHRAFQDWDQVIKEEWYWVYGSYCNRFRRVLTPRLFSIDMEGLTVIESGTKLEFSEVSGGKIILRPAKPTFR